MAIYYKVVQEVKEGKYRSAITAPSLSLVYRIGEKTTMPENSLGIFAFEQLSLARDWKRQAQSTWNKSLYILEGEGAKTSRTPHIVFCDIDNASKFRAFFRKVQLNWFYGVAGEKKLNEVTGSRYYHEYVSIPTGAVTLKWFIPKWDIGA